MIDENDYSCVVVNGIVFYYVESDIPLSKDEILTYIKSVSSNLGNEDDNVFTIVFDETQGLYHY